MHLYGLIIGITIIIGIDYFSKHNHLFSKTKETAFFLGLIISAIIGARAYHVIDQWSFYSQNLWLIPQTWRGGLGIFGALIGAFIFVSFFCRFHQVKLLSLLDLATPILPFCQFIGRFGNFVNHENPIWWEEAILDFTLFLFIKKFSKNPTAKYLIGYGILRFITEFWRNDTWVINSIKIGQIISILFIITGIILFDPFHFNRRITKIKPCPKI
jgi:phosphatidylglycerol:prolipoprotein diacylglycerol transferase